MRKIAVLLLAAGITTGVFLLGAKLGAALIPLVHLPGVQFALRLATPFILVVAAAPAVYRRIRAHGFFSVDL